MKVMTKILFALVLALPVLTACKKDEAKAEKVVVKVDAPTTDDDNAWATYIQSVVQQNVEGVEGAPFVYFLPASAAKDAGMKERLLIEAQNAVARGVIPGNMLVFASPDSKAISGMAVNALGFAEPGAMKGSQVMFIGKSGDEVAVKAAADKAGANFKFVEVK